MGKGNVWDFPDGNIPKPPVPVPEEEVYEDGTPVVETE